MKTLCLAVLFWATFLIAPKSLAENLQVKIVQSDVRKSAEALYAGDVDTVLKYTHPKVIADMGGTVKAKETLSKTLALFQQKKMKLVSMKFPEAPTFFRDSDNEYCFVPTLSIVESQGRKVESLNFQMGIKPFGSAEWTYVEGSRLNKENAKALFPNFPSDINFPSFYRKAI